jgi:hypothetical protein
MASTERIDERTTTSTRYRVRRVSLGSLSKFACVLGAMVGCLPGLLIGWVGSLVAGGLRRLLESWQNVSIHVLGQELGIDFISLLNLETALSRLQQADSLSWVLLPLLVLLGSLLGALLFLLMGNLGGWMYNATAALTGGLEVELEDLTER